MQRTVAEKGRVVGAARGLAAGPAHEQCEHGRVVRFGVWVPHDRCVEVASDDGECCCAVGDYDGDGLPDLIVSTFQDEPNSLYHNEGAGRFTYASYRAGIGNAAARVDSRCRCGSTVTSQSNDADRKRA